MTMAKPRFRSARQFVLMLVVCAGSAALGFVLRADTRPETKAKQSASPHDLDEKIVKIYRYPVQPYRIDRLSVRGIRISPGVKFSATSVAAISGGAVGDWFENLEFTVANESDKVETYIRIQLDYPDPLDEGQKMATVPNGLGRPPWASKTGQTYAPLALKPGESTSFRLPADELQGIENFLATRNVRLTDISEVEIRLTLVTFSDGTKWENGDFWKPNPSARFGFERVDQ
jgi:hypothetical protein